MSNNFTPLLDRVLIKPTPVEEKTAAGIILAQSDVNAAPTQGIVIATGPGRIEFAHRVPMSTRVGDHVIWNKFAGSKITVEGEELLVMRESDIIGIIKESTVDGLNAIDKVLENE